MPKFFLKLLKSLRNKLDAILLHERIKNMANGRRDSLDVVIPGLSLGIRDDNEWYWHEINRYGDDLESKDPDILYNTILVQVSRRYLLKNNTVQKLARLICDNSPKAAVKELAGIISSELGLENVRILELEYQVESRGLICGVFTTSMNRHNNNGQPQILKLGDASFSYSKPVTQGA